MDKLPDFLIEMSKQINTQDNRITADPLWMVCYDKEYPTSEDYGEYYQLLDCENEYHVIYCSKNTDGDESESVKEYMREHYENWFNDNLLDEDDELRLEFRAALIREEVLKKENKQLHTLLGPNKPFFK